jgi:hypothetical protein
MKLNIVCEKLPITSRRFFRISPFRFYALADGIKYLLAGSSLSAPPARPHPAYSFGLLAGLGLVKMRKVLKNSSSPL